MAEPINRLPKFVVSNTLTRCPWGDGDVEILRGDGAEAAAALKERYAAIVVWGSLTLADSLFEAGSGRRAPPAHRARAHRRGSLVHAARSSESGDSSSTTW